MARKERYPPEPETKRDHRRPATARQSGAAPKSDRERSEAPTVPPPGSGKPLRSPSVPRSPLPPGRLNETRGSAARATEAAPRRGTRRSTPAATVDEVVADMSNDPRREREDDE